jgi:hypothetical protein
MSNHTRNRRSSPGPRPGDFPLGSVESRAAARATQVALRLASRQAMEAHFRNLTPLEKAMIEGIDDPNVQAIIVRVIREVILPRHEMFGVPLPTFEENRERIQARRTG